MKSGSSQTLHHKDVFTVGDRSFRWEYPDNSPHLLRKREAYASPKKSPKANVLTPNNNRDIKGIDCDKHYCATVSINAFKD